MALSAAWMFFVHLFTSKRPMFDRVLLANRNLLTGLGFMLIVGVLMLATMALLPPMLQSLYGYPVLDTGLLLVVRGIGMVGSMYVAGVLTARGVDPRYLVGAGLAIAAVSLWEMTGWTLMMGASHFVVTGLIQGLGLGLIFIPLNIIAFATLPPSYRTDGSSLMNLFRNLGGSIGISIVTALLARNIQTSHVELGERITGFSLSSIDPSIASAIGAAGQTVTAMMNAEVTRQAAMIAYLDNFKLMMILTLLAIPLVVLLKRPTGAAPLKAGADAMGH